MSRKEYVTLESNSKNCEALIRKGQLREAVRILKAIPLKKVPKENRLTFANFARRTGQLHLGFRLLHGMIDRKANIRRGEAQLIAEYANLLTLNGCVGEAQGILKNVDLQLHPDLLLAMAWCHFEKWDYAPAIPLLKNYTLAQENTYLRWAGEINLAEAYLATGKFKVGIGILTQAIQATKQEGYLRLLANGLHLRAQALQELGQIEGSDRDLDLAMSIFGKSEASDAMLIRRQVAFNSAQKSRNMAPIRKFREEAQRAGSWESVRECDFQLLKKKFNRELYDHLYYGTSYPSYRKRLTQTFKIAETDYFVWGDRAGPCLDLRKRSFFLGGKNVKITKQSLGILDSLLRDFYRPMSIGRVFAEIFPQENFDPLQSPVRVHQALKRLRQWLKHEEIPLEVRCIGKRYSIRRLAPFCIRIPLELRISELPLSEAEKLSSHFKARYFSAQEARSILGVSKATMTRHLAMALDQGEVEKLGQGKITTYRCRQT